MNHRRKRPRRNPKCGICTPHRMGNSKSYDQGTHGKVSREAWKQTGTK